VPHCFEYMKGRQSILFQIPARTAGAQAHVGVGSKVEDKIMPGQPSPEVVRRKQIALDQPKTRRAQREAQREPAVAHEVRARLPAERC